MTVLEDKLQTELQGLHGDWQVIFGRKLRREFVFQNFQEGLSFVNKVGEVAEKLGHHPDVNLCYDRVVIELWTHDLSALSEMDFAFAREIEKLV